jgi:PAS domain S-box
MTSDEWDGELRRLALDTLFDVAPYPIYVNGPDGRFIAGNQALAARTGFPWEKLREMDFRPTVHPDDVDLVQREFEAAAAGETRRFRARGMRPDGSVFHAEVLDVPVIQDGEVLGVLGIALDADELADARQSLDAVQARLFTALDGVTEAMAFVDADWRITFLNDAATAFLGHGAPNLVGTVLWDLQLPDPEGEAMLREAMASRRTLTRRRFDEGLQRWIELTGFPAGDLLGVKVRDFTEIEVARRQRLDDSRRIHAHSMLLESANDAIIMRGLDGIIEYANQASKELLGIAELEGQPLRGVLKLDAETGGAIENAIGRTGTWRGDVVVRRPDGTVRITEGQWRVVDDPEGNPDAVFCILLDVTERREQEALLMRTQRMESLGTLASGIAHDLNNVLTPLLLSTQLLAADETDPQRRRILDGMRQTVERGSDMIRQVLTFARGVEGQRTIVAVDDIVRQFSDFCRDVLPKDIRVEVEAEPGLAVLGDPTQLLQVLVNLATNARDAMEGGGLIRLTVSAVDDRVVLEVADDGSGMAPDVLNRMFEPFYTTKGMGRGTGLGLSVSQAIARAHGGTLEATSRPGAGTTFRLELPRAECSDVTAAAVDDDAPPVDLAGLRVLIVDDESEIVNLASLIVDRAGGAPMTAYDATEAQRLLRGTAMDVVLTDLVMPGTTGRAFLDWLAERHPELPVVAMSGVPEQGAHAARRDNVRVSLDKPFTAEQLLAALDAARGAGT